MDRRVHRDAIAWWSAVTVRVTTLKGVDAGSYYVEQLPNYYLDSGEPRGVWLGAAATELGLAGEVDDDSFLALMAGKDPRDPDRDLGRRFGEKSVRGFDVTASAPKSVSVLFALGDRDVRREVVASHDAAVAALQGWIEAHAHTRYRIGGEVAMVDAKGIVAAGFRQHTSRALDPQLHTHLVIPNRVMSPDGRWLALDARLIKLDQQSLSGIYHASLRAEMTGRLGVSWVAPVNGIAEIADVPADLLVEFSARTTDIRRRVDDKLDRFTDTMGRDPTPRERWRLEREAAIDCRPVKAHAVDADVLHAGWAEQTRQLGHDPAAVVAAALDIVVERGGIDEPTRGWMIDQTIVAMSEKQSTWRPTQLHRELAALVPTVTAVSAGELTVWLDGVVDEIVATRCVDISKPAAPGDLLRRDGRPVSESVADRALTTQAILDQERALIDWVDRRLTRDGIDAPDAAGRSLKELDVAQAAVAAAVAGDADIVMVVGPAGTGKTTALAPAVAEIRAAGRVVFGVAPSATAAEVLAEETGLVADTLDKLLIEHRLTRPPGDRFDLPAGATVIVDEAGMTSTAKLFELAKLADVKGWRVALVGDPLQFSAVGRGGMFGLLVDTFGAIELERVHRFDNEWERDASLRLRHGDISVADIYQQHGRLHGGTAIEMERGSVARWFELRTAGKAALLMTPTNEATERLNARCQHTRIRNSELDTDGTTTTAGPYRLFIGDEIATRHNDRRLLTDRGVTVKNRAVWTIDTISVDGAVTATGKAGTVTLPGEYVAAHVDLAYARTGMGGQGRTVKGGLLYSDGATDLRNLYVPLTRGTETNEAFFATTGEETALDVFIRSMTTDWIDQPAHARRDELNNTTPHRPGLLDTSHLRQLVERRFEIGNTLQHAATNLRRAGLDRQTAHAGLEAAEQRITRQTAALEHANDVLARYDRPLHRRNHEHDIAKAQHSVRALPYDIAAASLEVTALKRKIANTYVAERDATAVLAQRPQLESEVRTIDDQLTNDLHARTRIASLEQPDSITEMLGRRPTPGEAARTWDRAAGLLAQHQTAFGIARGAGPQPRWDLENAYSHSHHQLTEAIAIVRPAPTRRIEIEPPSIEL